MKFKSQHVFMWILITIGSVSLFNSYRHIILQRSNASAFLLHQLAEPFEELKPLFKNQRSASYITDKDIELPAVIAQFELAQYTLAPTVLKLNDSQGPLVLVDASHSESAMNIVKLHHLTALKINKNGLMLAIKSDQLPPL